MGVHIGAASWRQQGASSSDAVLTSERGGAGGDGGGDGGAGTGVATGHSEVC